MTDAKDEKSEVSTPEERAAAIVGRTLSDRYKIVSLVAMGGMGAVYRAEHLLMRKHVAVKVLHPEVENFPELVARFEREAVAGAHVQHPNVATASDFGKFDGESRFLVLEFISGATLRELMDKRALSPARAARIARQVASALSAIHKKGIVHRDLKPRNVMIIDDTRETRAIVRGSNEDLDVVKVIDFGLSKVPVEELSQTVREADEQAGRDLTQAGVVMGTIGYIAPEAALGMRSVLAPADLYSLGVIFYEMLCGKPPFEAPTKSKLFALHVRAPVPPMAERNPKVKVPAEMEAIARRLLAKDPEDRYPSAAAVIEALDAALGRGPARKVPVEVLARAPVDARPQKPSAPPRWPWIAASVAAVGLVAFFVTRSGETTTHEASSALADAAAPETSASSGGAKAAPPRAPSAVVALRAAAESNDGAKAAAAFLRLADEDRAAFDDRAVQAEAAPVVELAASSGHAADPVFDRLSGELGEGGLDILYDLAAREQRTRNVLESHGLAPPSGAGPRARAILGRPDVLARATPAMRIAYELRRAPCHERPLLFPRAAKDGDDRALEILIGMQPPACSHKDACCFPKHRELERAVAEIQARIRR